MDKEELRKILDAHIKWYLDDGGERADLSGADLSDANLNRAYLREADLHDANLRGAKLSNADLWAADLHDANLRGADLLRANLRDADMHGADLREAKWRGADLSSANLCGADMCDTYLCGANLRGANLYYAKIEFHYFPTIRLISSIALGPLSDDLTLELMRRDASAHPRPAEFDAWAAGARCPYQFEERFWFFAERRNLWQPGPPTMRDADLILAICREKRWKIKNYL